MNGVIAKLMRDELVLDVFCKMCFGMQVVAYTNVDQML